MEESKSTSTAKGLTAAIIVIGDEILKGHVQDINSHFICKELWKLGVKVSRIVVVGDDLEAIAEEVRSLSPLYDFVLTSGGVGPTHDDVTMEAVGKAFSEDLAPHPEILKFLFPGDPNSPSNLKSPWRNMALVPRSTCVHIKESEDKEDFSFLLMAVRNVHCYPGVPSLLKNLFAKSKDLYSTSRVSFYLKEVFFSSDEDVLVGPLTQLQREFPSVQLGSYPEMSPVNSHRVRIALESTDREMIEEVYSRLLLSLPSSVMMSSRSSYTHPGSKPDIRESVSEIFGFSPSRSSLFPDSLCSVIHDSLDILQKALDDYSMAGLCVAFNGGKDCTVILALLKRLLSQKNNPATSSKIKILCVIENEQFPEVNSFVKSTARSYDLDVIIKSGGIKQALSDLKSTNPDIRAVCMGTRRTDPHSSDLEPFSRTDSSWPDYMRINCILEWSYRDVWLFLKLCDIPYCKLYDRGYTSLDGVADTYPNPALLIPSPSCAGDQTARPPAGAYLPACMLGDQQLERAGRTTS